MRFRRFLIYAMIYAAIAYVSIAAFRLPHPPLWAMATGILVGLIPLRVVTYILNGLEIKSGKHELAGNGICISTLAVLAIAAVCIGVYWDAISGWLFCAAAIGAWVLHTTADPIRIVEGDLERVSFKLIKVLTAVGWVTLFVSSFAVHYLAQRIFPHLANLNGEIFALVYLLWPALALFGCLFWGMTGAAIAHRPYKISRYGLGLVVVAAAPIFGALSVMVVGSDTMMIGRLAAELIVVAATYWVLYLLARPTLPVSSHSKSDAAAIRHHLDHDPHFLVRIS